MTETMETREIQVIAKLERIEIKLYKNTQRYFPCYIM